MAAFRAAKPRIRLHLSGDRVIPGADHALPFDVASYEEGQDYTLPATQLVIERDGLYDVRGYLLRISASATGTSQITLRNNGLEIARAVWAANSTGIQALWCPHLQPFTEGDVLTWLYRGTTSAVATALLGWQTSLWLTRVGPKRWT